MIWSILRDCPSPRPRVLGKPRTCSVSVICEAPSGHRSVLGSIQTRSFTARGRRSAVSVRTRRPFGGFLGGFYHLGKIRLLNTTQHWDMTTMGCGVNPRNKEKEDLSNTPVALITPEDHQANWQCFCLLLMPLLIRWMVRVWVWMVWLFLLFVY